MEDRRVLFISVKSCENKEPSAELLKEAEVYVSWLASKLSDKSIIFSSGIFECIQFALLISEKTKKPHQVIMGLSRLVHQGSLSSSTNCNVPGFQGPQKEQALIKFLTEGNRCCLVILEENMFKQLNFDCKSRNQSNSSMHELIVEDEAKESQCKQFKGDLVKSVKKKAVKSVVYFKD